MALQNATSSETDSGLPPAGLPTSGVLPPEAAAVVTAGSPLALADADQALADADQDQPKAQSARVKNTVVSKDATKPSLFLGAQVEKIGFDRSDDFQKEVRAKMKAYFKEKGISQNANAAMVLKSAFWMSSAFAFYISALLGGFDRLPTLALWVVGSGFLACIGFNVGHDAIHGSYSKRPWVNNTLRFAFDLMGASSFNWGISHCFQHHTYTNIKEADADIEPGPVLRFYPDPDQVKWFHRFQHLYAWPLYALNSVNWIFVADWIQILQVDPRTGKKRPTKEKGLYLFGKAMHMTAFVALPLLLTPYSIFEIAFAYVAAAATGGLILALVFQAAHVVEGIEWPLPDENREMGMAWFEHQMRTTANFGGGNPLVTFFVGGLDYQVEHHLFPKVCHIHYPALAPMVRETAAKYGLPYHENKAFTGALASHYRTLKRLGRAEDAAEMLAEQKNLQSARLAAGAA